MSSQTPDIATYVRLSPALRDRLAEIALSEHRTLSGEIRYAIERHVAAVTEREGSEAEAA